MAVEPAAGTAPHDVVFSPSARRMQAIAREIADHHVQPLAAECDRERKPNRQALAAVAEAGLQGALIPEAHGGSEAGLLAVCLAAEELAKADPGFGVAYAAGALGTLPLLLAGTDEQKAHWLPGIARGEVGVAFCATEREAGSDLSAMTTRATPNGGDGSGGWRLDGGKKWITNGADADLYTVFAVTDPDSRSRRMSAFLVERGTPGLEVVKVEETMGIRTVSVAELRFDGVRLPAGSLLGGRPGGGYPLILASLDRARPVAAAQAVGAAQGALDLAVGWAGRRRQYGQPIANLQLVQKLLADMAIRTEAARWLTYAAAARADAEGLTAPPTAIDPRRKLAAMAKCCATDAAMAVATDAVQVFGGYGYMEDHPIAKFFRDAKISQIYEGTNQIQRLTVASALIKEMGSLAPEE